MYALPARLNWHQSRPALAAISGPLSQRRNPVGGVVGERDVATALLSDLVERGLDPEQGMLFVLDGSKALRKAVRWCSARSRCRRQEGCR
jgi:hypothetical protein